MSELTSPSWPLSDGWVVFLMSSSTRWWLAFPWWAQYDQIFILTLTNHLQDEPQILGTTNGSIGNRRLFQCHPNHGMFVPMSELVKEEDFLHLISGHQREARSVSRSSSRSDRGPVYMNTGQQQPTYQNHFFDSQEWWDRGRPGRHRQVSVSCLVQTFLHTNWENNTKTRRIKGSSSRGNSTVKIFLFYTISRGNLRRFFLEQVSRDGAISNIEFKMSFWFNHKQCTLTAAYD